MRITNQEARRVGNLPATYSKEAEVLMSERMGEFVSVAKLASSTAGNPPAYFRYVHNSREGLEEITFEEYRSIVIKSVA